MYIVPIIKVGRTVKAGPGAAGGETVNHPAGNRITPVVGVVELQTGSYLFEVRRSFGVPAFNSGIADGNQNNAAQQANDGNNDQ